MGVSENRGTPKSSILIRFSIIFTMHLGVPLFLETPKWSAKKPGDLRPLQYGKRGKRGCDGYVDAVFLSNTQLQLRLK